MQLFIGTLVGVFLIQLLVSAVILWLVCKLFRRGAAPIGFRRALLATVLLAFLNVPIALASFKLNDVFPLWLMVVVDLLVAPLLLVLVLKLSLRLSFGK